MLDNIREWISDNLRYILIGVAGILILVIAFFAVRLISGLGSPKEQEPETQQVTENDKAEAQTDAERSESLLERNQEEVLDVITRYCTARAAKDYDTLAQIWEVFDETTTPAELEREDAAVESYSNIMTYSKPGMTDGSYVVYVYLDIKLTGINTLAPSLWEEYLITNESGDLVIADKESSKELQDFLLELQSDEDVQVLIADVDQKLEDAKEQDEDLKNFVESGTSAGTSDSTESGSDTTGTGDQTSTDSGSSTGTISASTGVNVRGTPSAEGVLYGVVSPGIQVEILENTSDGWSKIRYTTNGTTIEGYVMTQYIS